MNDKIFTKEWFNKEVDKLKNLCSDEIDEVMGFDDDEIEDNKNEFLNSFDSIINNQNAPDDTNAPSFYGMEYLDIDTSLDVLGFYGYAILRSDKDTIIKYIDTYFKAALGLYVFYEYEYTRFGNLEYLYQVSPLNMYLCGKYYESINDYSRAKMAYFILISSRVNCLLEEPDSLSLFEEYFDSFKDLIFNDWLAIHPRITLAIGKYYLKNEDYEKAFEFFEMGSSISYEGRQSIEPLLKSVKTNMNLETCIITA